MFRRTAWPFLPSIALGVVLSAAAANATIVFSTDFDSGLPPEFSAPGAGIEPVQGFAGYGTASIGDFTGSFLRYDDAQVVDTELTLTNLPPHDHLALGFLLAVIDSWDGTELLQVLVDDNLLFSNTFSLATEDASSYVAPPEGLLESSRNFGFNSGTFYDRDRCYDMSREPAFAAIPHEASSVSIVWRVSAAAGGQASFWQGGLDESWAIDNVKVSVFSLATTTTTMAPTTTTTSTTTSSSTSSSTTTATPTTGVPVSTSTTTLPPDECLDVPSGPTFSSVICRLATELVRVEATADLGSLQPKLAQALSVGRDRATQGRSLCSAGNVRGARSRLKQVDRALVRYARRLSGSPARRALDDALRTTFLTPTPVLRADVKTLRKGLRCPDAAG